MFNLLPTITPHASVTYNRPHCSYCNKYPDTWMHILICPEPHRRETFMSFLTDLNKFLSKSDTDPFLQQSIIHGIKTWIGTADPIQAPDSAMFQNQSDIGWKNFLKGLWHVDWCLEQNRYLKSQNTFSNRETGTLWAVRTIEFIYNGIHGMWIDYTKLFHKPDKGPTATQQRLATKICHLQKMYAQACPHHSHQFFIDSETASSQPVSHLRNWLKLYEPIVMTAAKLQRQAEKLQQHLLTHFYPRLLSK